MTQTRWVDSLEGARITQATVLGGDVLIALSDGTSALLDAQDLKRLASTAAKAIVTDQEVDPL